MSLRQSTVSTEFVKVGPVDTGQVNPTSDVVEMAFLAPSATPVAGDWKTAVWRSGGPPYYIMRLVYGSGVIGPPGGSTVLAVGTYVIWVRIHDNPETPARPVDVLTIYGA